MKPIKLVMFLLCLGFVFNNISFWQSWASNSWNIYTWEYKQVTETLLPQWEAMDKIQKIAYYFCNSGLKDRLELQSRPGQRQEICVIFGNKNTETVEIIFWFPDWWTNKNWAVICSADLTWKNYITSLMKKTSQSDFYFELMPKQQLIKKFYITIPQNQTWNIYWCWSFKIKWDIQKAKTWSMFNIEIVKKATINIQVTWSVYNYWLIDNIQTTIIDNKNNILKWLILIIGIRLVISTIQSISKKKHTKHHKK